MNVTNYKIGKPNLFTPAGCPVYSKSKVNLELIDTIIEETEFCLNMSLNTNLFMVYIPDDWYISPCSFEQLFPCTIVEVHKKIHQDPDYNICKELKDLDVTEECPCNCRAMIQDENIIITAPNLKVFPQELVRMMTGENNPYRKKWTRRCIKTPSQFL